MYNNRAMKLLDDPKYVVERAVIRDALDFENGELVVSDERAAAVKVSGWYKCVFADISDYPAYAERYGIYGNVCIMGAPPETPAVLGFETNPCITYAYLDAMPPSVGLPRGTEVKRLAPSLAGTVAQAYYNPGGGYTEERMAEIMRIKGVFGAITEGKLAGFIGRHGDGSMGMLTVFEPFRRRGIGEMLERFMINFVMTFGRVPVCDVHLENDVSLHMQKNTGLTPGCGYTYWTEIERK